MIVCGREGVCECVRVYVCEFVSVRVRVFVCVSEREGVFVSMSVCVCVKEILRSPRRSLLSLPSKPPLPFRARPLCGGLFRVEGLGFRV
jgi:hypothetical protein